MKKTTIPSHGRPLDAPQKTLKALVGVEAKTLDEFRYRKEDLQSLPHEPGVYLMLNKHDEVIYVGKAKVLSNRVRSYFRTDKAHSLKTKKLVSHVASIEVLVAQSEFDALLIEQGYIKHYRPKFNILLRDDKSYPYIHLSTQESFAGVKVMHVAHHNPKMLEGKGAFFGPYTASKSRALMLLMRRVFGIRSCTRSQFNQGRVCMEYAIKHCSGPCEGKIAQEDYQKRVSEAADFLSGNEAPLIQNLTDAMNQASQEERYERALMYQRLIQDLETFQEEQAQQAISAVNDLDVWALGHTAHKACASLFRIRGGQVQFHRHFTFSGALLLDADDALVQIVLQYYAHVPSEQIPKELVLEISPEHANLLVQSFDSLWKRSVRITRSPKLSKRHWLLTAKKNAQSYSQASEQSEQRRHKGWMLLAQKMCRESLHSMACIDISHFGGVHPVASYVFSEEGALKHELYRRMNLKDTPASDDYEGMRESIRRIYIDIHQSFKRADVLVLDGGKGQLSSAHQALAKLTEEGVPVGTLDILGSAKGKSRKFGDEIFFHMHYAPGEAMHIQKINLDASQESQSFRQIVRALQEEAHRFAITAQRKKTRADARVSLLEEIEGIGPKRRAALLRAFGSARGVLQASKEDVAAVSGIGAMMANEIQNHLRERLLD